MAPTDVVSSGSGAGKSGRVTLRQIAEEAGLPLMTVSRALRNLPGKVAPAARARVLEVAERLRYRPNLLVQGIQTGLSRNIGVVVPATSEFCGGIIRGIHDALVTEGWLPILDWHHQAGVGKAAADAELHVIHRLVDRRVDGVILFPAEAWVAELHLEEVWKRRIPLVTVDHQIRGAPTDFVGTDDALGGRLAARHLLDLGHRRIGHLAGNQRYPAYAERRKAFTGALRSAGAEVALEESADEDPDTIRRAARRLLERNPRPTAVFCASDHQALEVYAQCQALGLRIPQDLSVMGCADLHAAAYLSPPLTTLRQDPQGIGREAAALVLERCRGGRQDGTARTVRLTPTLIPRGSTAPPGPG